MEMGTMPYIKRKVRHKADRPNNNEWEKREPDVHGCNCGAPMRGSLAYRRKLRPRRAMSVFGYAANDRIILSTATSG
ncbi:MAG: hypothetical protein J6C44_04240 [Muribaculaceae bacterium]|nr:hypothetical protein [Muribaculaceae bacterium]